MYATIFGNKYKFNSDPDMEVLLKDVLQLYQTPSPKSSVDVEVTFTKSIGEAKNYSQNPSIHKYSPKVTSMKMGNVWISWEKSHADRIPLQVSVSLPKTKSLKRVLSRLRSIEFASETEALVQILHELVLVPTQYFFFDKAPIHAAAVGSAAGCVLIAGTGGVGKSSALLSVRDVPSLSFIADDISILDSKGGVFGNMAWPKIYGYNCIGNKFEKELFKDRGVFDMFHFKVRNRIDPTKVRRKIRPDKLFKLTESDRVHLKALVYVFREDTDQISIETLGSDVAAALSCSVLESEYSIFHDHIRWSEYNSKMLGSPALLCMDDIRKNWFETYQSAFTGLNCVKLSVPLQENHSNYQSYIRDFISETLS